MFCIGNKKLIIVTEKKILIEFHSFIYSIKYLNLKKLYLLFESRFGFFIYNYKDRLYINILYLYKQSGRDKDSDKDKKCIL